MWPEDQKLAKSSRLLIEVTNQGEEVIPDVAVTVLGFDYELRDPDNRDLPDPDVADPERPQFVVDKSPIEFLTEKAGPDDSLVDKEVAVPYGRQTAYVGTYTLGELDPDETAIFRWDVTAVKAGPYQLNWSVAGGTEPGRHRGGHGRRPRRGQLRRDRLRRAGGRRGGEGRQVGRPRGRDRPLLAAVGLRLGWRRDWRLRGQ